MDSLIAFYKKNQMATVVALLLIPIAGALIYGSIKSFWLRKKNKQNSIAIYEYLVASGADLNAQTTDAIAKALNISRNDVVGLCSEHPKIADAGKRQRSWKINTEVGESAEATVTEEKNRK